MPPTNSEQREQDMPTTISAPDAQAVDHPETEANESEMMFNWAKMDQWSRRCVQQKMVEFVKSHSHSKRVRAGSTCTRIGKVTTCRPRYRTDRWTTYTQEYKSQCIKYEYTRACPAGQGKYEKQIPEGQCMKLGCDAAACFCLQSEVLALGIGQTTGATFSPPHSSILILEWRVWTCLYLMRSIP